MKNQLLSRLALVFSFSLVLINAGSADLLDRIHREQKKVDTLNAEIATLQTDIGAGKSDAAGAKKLARKLKQRDEAAYWLKVYQDQRDGRVERINGKIADNDSYVKQLEDKKKQKQAELDKLTTPPVPSDDSKKSKQEEKGIRSSSDDEKQRYIDALKTEIADIGIEVDRVNTNTGRKKKRVDDNTDPTPIASTAPITSDSPSASPSTLPVANTEIEVACGELLLDGSGLTRTEGCPSPSAEVKATIHTGGEADLESVLKRKREIPECWVPAAENEIESIRLLSPPFPVGKDKLSDDQMLSFTQQIQAACTTFDAKFAGKESEIRVGRIETKAGSSHIPGKDNEGLAQSRAKAVDEYVFGALGFEKFFGAERFVPGVKRDPKAKIAGPEWSKKAMKEYFGKEVDDAFMNGKPTKEELATASAKLKTEGNPSYRPEDLEKCCSKKRTHLLYYPYQYTEVVLHPSVFKPNDEACKAKVPDGTAAVNTRTTKEGINDFGDPNYLEPDALKIYQDCLSEGGGDCMHKAQGL